jgi:hypothetical protein
MQNLFLDIVISNKNARRTNLLLLLFSLKCCNKILSDLCKKLKKVEHTTFTIFSGFKHFNFIRPFNGHNCQRKVT